MQLLLATENQGKKKELLSILGDTGFECVLPSELSDQSFTYPEETGDTFSENAHIKADFIFQKFQISTVADDSGLSVVSLDNFPGLKSARWLAGSDSDRCQGLLNKLAHSSDRSAFFTSVICFIDQVTKQVHYFEGILQGFIAFEEKGNAGFGYDPIFIPSGQTHTLAELGESYKNQFSHRALALKKLTDFLKNSMVD